MHQAMDALEGQRQMLEYFESSRSMASFMLTLYSQLGNQTLPSMARLLSKSSFTNEDEDAIRLECAKTFRMADTYWVQQNMVELVNSVYQSMPSHPMTQETFPVAFGWMYLARTAMIELPDWDAGISVSARTERGLPPAPSVTIRAFTWRRCNQVTAGGKYRPGYEIWTYVDKDVIEREVRRGLESPRLEPTFLRDMGPYVSEKQMFWADGQTAPDGSDSMLDLLVGSWIQAAAVLMDMPIAARSHAPRDRKVDRRIERAQLPIKAVTIVTLRTPRSKREGPEPEHGREYTHRWLVRGFWRNQYYPSTGEHKVIYIHAFVKGPAGAPLIIKQRVNAWVR